MKYYKILTILILSLSFVFSQTYRTTSDGFGGSTTTSSDGTTYRTTSDGFGGSTTTGSDGSSYRTTSDGFGGSTTTTTSSSNWWD